MTLVFGMAGFLWLAVTLVNFGIPAWVLVLDYPITAVALAVAMWTAVRSAAAQKNGS